MASDKTLALRAKQPRKPQPHRRVLPDGSLGEPLVSKPSLRRSYRGVRRQPKAFLRAKGIPPWKRR